MSVGRIGTAATQRKIAFAAPETIHGALKQIVGWAEMKTTSRNVRIAAKAHLKKAEAALAVLDKQGSPPEAKKETP